MGGNNVKGALLALLAFAIFATHDVVVKTLGATYSPVQIVFFSVTFSFPLVALMLMRDQTDGNLIPRHPWWTALRTLSVVVTAVTAFYAFSVLPLAQTYAILFATPLLITLLAIPVLGERVGIRRGIAVVVGLLGVMVVLRPGAAELSLGHLAAVAAAVCSSLASVIVRKIGPEERSVVLLLYPMVTNFILLGCALPLVYVPMPIEHLGLVGIISALGMAGMLLIISAYRRAEAAIVAPMQYSQMIWAVLFGSLLFDEAVDSMTILGAAVIIASGIYIVMREAGKARDTQRPVLRTQARPETGVLPRVSSMMGLAGRSDPRAHRRD
jgi:S-adenosylmethionine uptake transporter